MPLHKNDSDAIYISQAKRYTHPLVQRVLKRNLVVPAGCVCMCECVHITDRAPEGGLK